MLALRCGKKNDAEFLKFKNVYVSSINSRLDSLLFFILCVSFVFIFVFGFLCLLQCFGVFFSVLRKGNKQFCVLSFFKKQKSF